MGGKWIVLIAVADRDDADMSRVIGTFESADEAHAWMAANDAGLAYYMDAMDGSRLTVMCLDSGDSFIEDMRQVWANG